MKPCINNPTRAQLIALYESGQIYNLRNLPDHEHRLYVHPRLMLRHESSQDFKYHPFWLHSTESLYSSVTTIPDLIESALFKSPNRAYYEFGKLKYRFNDYFASALKTGQFFII